MCTYIHSKMWKADNFTMLVLLEDDPINIEDPLPHQKKLLLSILSNANYKNLI